MAIQFRPLVFRPILKPETLQCLSYAHFYCRFIAKDYCHERISSNWYNMHSAFNGAVPYCYLFSFFLSKVACSSMNRLRLSLAQYNKKYLARSFCLTSGYTFTAKTSDRYPSWIQAVRSVKALLSFWFRLFLTDFYSQLHFAKRWD